MKMLANSFDFKCILNSTETSPVTFQLQERKLECIQFILNILKIIMNLKYGMYHFLLNQLIGKSLLVLHIFLINLMSTLVVLLIDNGLKWHFMFGSK